MQGRPQHLLAEAVVVPLQHLLVYEHGETVQLAEGFFDLSALRHGHVDVQRDAADIPCLTMGQIWGMPQLVECGVVGLPGDASEQAQLVKLSLPDAVLIACEVDRKELRDEQQRLFAVLVR